MTARDITTGAFQILGLRQTAENFATLEGSVKDTIARDSLRVAGKVVAAAVQGTTYSTFKRQTGAIAAGLRVSIGAGLRGDVLFGVVGEYPTPLAGPAGGNIRAMMKRGKGSVRALDRVPFWWRFLELGTGERHTRTTPKFLRRSSAPSTPRQAKAFAKWLGSPSRGRVAPRPWVEPAASSAAAPAVEAFRAAFAEATDKAVTAMPK